MQNAQALMMKLLGNQLTGSMVEFGELSQEQLASIYVISAQQDLSHIVSFALAERGLLRDSEISKKFQKQQMLAVFRTAQMESELVTISKALEGEQIPFIPLKGAVLRELYPEPWMRTSCDIDILIQEQDLARTSELLVNSLSYTQKERGTHDVSFYTPSGIHVELHYRLMEAGIAGEAQAVLSQVWRRAYLCSGFTCRMNLCDEMFYFYHIAHMAMHVQFGGCGVRPFLDLWILDHKVEHDFKARDELLSSGGLLTFATAVRRLSRVWFEGAEADSVSQKLQEYILSGGVYGTQANYVQVQQSQKGGKLRYLLSRIFLPYDRLKYYYPVLQRHKWLLPLMQVRRWFRVFFGGRAKQLASEIKATTNISQQRMDETSRFLAEIGL